MKIQNKLARQIHFRFPLSAFRFYFHL